MGGFGSGRRQYSLRETVDHCRILDASICMREGILRQDVRRAGAWQWNNIATGEVTTSINFQVDTSDCDGIVRLTYTLGNGGEPLNYAILLETTEPQRGGLRWWITCPLVVNGLPCGRRVQKLYSPGRHVQPFGCRHCYDLSYDSRNQNARMRAIVKAQKIRRRLGGSPSMCEPFPGKPSGMWERTYLKWREQGLQAESRYLALTPM